MSSGNRWFTALVKMALVVVLTGLLGVPLAASTAGAAGRDAHAAASSSTPPVEVGYYLATSTGRVYSYGGAPWYGSTGGSTANGTTTGIARTADGKGYWLVTNIGKVDVFGDATW